MTVSIEWEAPAEKIAEKGFSSREEAEQIIRKVIRASAAAEACPWEVQAEVVLTGPEEIRELNRDYRDTDAATDVLSFPMLEPENPGDFSALDPHDPECFDPDTGELMLGSIVLNLERVLAQAEEYGHGTVRELAFLTAHSMYHLMGYDHMTQEEASVMEERQEAVLASLGISRT